MGTQDDTIRGPSVKAESGINDHLNQISCTVTIQWDGNDPMHPYNMSVVRGGSQLLLCQQGHFVCGFL